VTTPRVSVLMSVYNGERYLAEAVDSILAQTYRDFELIVIDDASTDRSAEILAAYRDERIRVLRNETNRGLTVSLNVGLAAARGELIARQDADDRSHPRRLEEQVAFLDAHPDVAAVGAQARVIDSRGAWRRRLDERKPVSPLAVQFSLIFIAPMAHGAAMFRRAVVWDELRGYDESFRTSQDAELWSRMAERWQIANVDQALLDFRVHPASVSSTMYSKENVARLEAVLRRNAERLTGDAPLAAEWPPLWIAIMNPHAFPTPANAARAVGIVDRLRDRFVESHRAAWQDRGVRETYGTVMLHLAAFHAVRDRSNAARAFLRGLRCHPAAALRAFPRLAALTLLGRGGLHILRKIRVSE
jgi:glycosyltransferase involved in cell wall biosynthesis